MKQRIITLCAALALVLSIYAKDEKAQDVNGTYTLTITDTSNLTLAEALHQCITSARVEAMRTAFHEAMSSDVIVIDENLNGQETSLYWENTQTRINADWITDSREPAITVGYEAHQLTITAEVWGKARLVTHNRAQIDLHVHNRGPASAPCRVETLEFKHGDAISIDFSTPASGYLAVYVIDQKSDKVNCLIPLTDTGDGNQKVVGGKAYTFFDPATISQPLELLTPYPLELDQLVVIYSPNSFVKCPEVAHPSTKLGYCTSQAFNQWLTKCRITDKEMTVETRTITIRNPKPTSL